MLYIIKKRWFQAIALVALLAAFVFASQIIDNPRKQKTESVVAEIDGVKITKLQFESAMNRRMTRLMALQGQISSSEREGVMLAVMKELINNQLLDSFAKKENVAVTPADLARKKTEIMDQIEKQYGAESGSRNPNVPNPEALFTQMWNFLGFRSEEEFMRDIRYELLEMKLADKLYPLKSFTLTDKELDDYIPKLALSQIFYNTETSIYNQKHAEQGGTGIPGIAEKKVERIWGVYDKLRAGADFAEMAKRYSEDASSANGGFIGPVAKNAVEKPFWDAVADLQPGQYTEPFETSQGLHIVKCLSRLDPQTNEYRALVQASRQTILYKKQKSSFVQWFWRKFTKMEQENKIVLYHPVLLANKLRNQGKYDEAVKQYRLAISRDRDGAAYYHLDIAMILARQAKYDEAIKEMRAATETSPTDPQLFLALGLGYMEIGQHENALKEFETASNIAKLNYQLHYNLMGIYSQLGMFEEADAEKQKYLHALELLKAGGADAMAPGSMFKRPKANLPPGAGAKEPQSIHESPGIDIQEVPVPMP